MQSDVEGFQKLKCLIERTCLMHDILDALWTNLPMQDFTNKRELAVHGSCLAVKEHIKSQIMLIFDHPLTTMALVRIAYENLLKAIWLRKGASDSYIEKLFTARPDDKIAEAVKQPSIKELLMSISDNHPNEISTLLQMINDTTIKAMHSFVHGGIYSLTHALIEIPERQRMNVLLNSNVLFMMATNVVLMPVLGSYVQFGHLKQIQEDFSDCFPPNK